jgi:hypothetical protein
LWLPLAAAIGCGTSVKDITSTRPVAESKILGKTYRLERQAYLVAEAHEPPTLLFKLENPNRPEVSTLPPGARIEIEGVRLVSVPPEYGYYLLTARVTQEGRPPTVVAIREGFAGDWIPAVALIDSFGPANVAPDASTALAALSSPDWPARFSAAEGIRRTAPDDASVAPSLAARLKIEPDPDVRWRLLNALTDESAAAIISDLCQVVSRPELNRIERVRCADLLEAQGPDAIEPIRAAIRTLGPGDHAVYSTFRGVIVSIGPEAKDAVPDLLAALDRVGYGRLDFAHGLFRVDPELTIRIMVEDGLRSDHVGDRMNTLWRLLWLGQGAAPAVPEIRRLAASDPEPQVREKAKSVLEELGQPF